MTATSAIDDVQLEDVNLMDPKWFADGPPHELFARMRRETPVRWNPLPDGTGFWSFVKNEHVVAISKDTGTFSSNKGGVFLRENLVAPLDLLRTVLLYKDPPEHTKYRKILNTAFTPRTVGHLEDAVRARFTRIIDEVIEAGECDFVKDIAVPGPLGVLAELMGLPDEDIDKLYHWTEGIEAGQRADEDEAAVDTFVEMSGYLWEQVERQKAAGVEDSLVMRLRAAEVDGEQLVDPEILTFFGLLVFAGNDTTRNTQAHGMQVLLEHPEAMAELRADPSLIPDAIEEVLRYTSVVQYFVRRATKDTEMGGQAIEEGDRVVIWYTSASRDEDLHDDADTFDIHRARGDRRMEHRAFGGGGRHFCLGAGLARLELRIVLEELLRRMPDLEAAGPAERDPNPWANMVVSLPVRFTPGEREAPSA